VGGQKLTAQQSGDFYDVLVERDKRAATVITSNRAVKEWVALFDDPILANSAFDRFAHRARQIVMQGPSLRAARAPAAAKSARRPTKNSPDGGELDMPRLLRVDSGASTAVALRPWPLHSRHRLEKSLLGALRMP